MKRFFVLSFIVLLFAFGCSRQSPEEVLEEFYNYYAPDSESLDPLIVAGEKVVPLIIERIQDKNMPRRRLAIEFLGNGSYRQAIPVLEKIFKDETEKEHFRVTALISIFQIDEDLGDQYAQQNREDQILGKTSNDILVRKDYVTYRRSYLDALFRRHD